MAQMRPSTFPDRAIAHLEDRENEVFELLASNLPEKAVVLYEPSLFDKRKRERKPDFILFWQQTDCVVIEVKNWNPKHILHGDGHKVYFQDERGKGRALKNPLVQAKDYQFALMKHLQRDAGDIPSVVSPTTGYLNFCVTPMVIMLNLKEEDLTELCDTMVGIRPEFIISEEALRDPKLLRSKLLDLPFPVKRHGDNEVLMQAAEILCPADLTQDELAARVREKAVQILPTVEYQLPSAPEAESEIDKYNRLRNELRSVTGEARELILSDTGDDSNHTQKLKVVMDDLSRDDFRIGLFGVTAAGKSTFINALLGEQIMRPGNGETSKTITVLRAPTEVHSHGDSLLQYKTYEELLQETLKYLNETEYLTKLDLEGFDLREASTRQDLAAWFKEQTGRGNRAEESARKFIQALLAGWDQLAPRLGTVDRGDFATVDKMLHDGKTGETMAVFVKERHVFYSNPFTEKQFVFYDSPGVGSSLSRHTQVAEEAAQKVDAAILLTKVDYKFMPPEREFVRNVVDRRRKTSSNLLCVLNQIGRIDPLNEGRPLEEFDQCVEEECDRLRERLSDEDLGDLKIFPVDSKCAYYSKRAVAEDCSEEEKSQFRRSAISGFTDPGGPDPDKNLDASRFLRMEEDLLLHLTKVKYRSFASKRLSDLEDICEDYRKDIEAEIHSMDLDIVHLEKVLKQHQENRKRVRRQLDGFMLGEFAKEVESIYGDIAERISELINKITEKAGQLYEEKYKSFSSTPSKFMEELNQELQKYLVKKVKRLRSRYEDNYEAIKLRVVNDEIPDIVSEYGNELKWSILLEDLDVATVYPVEGFEEIQPGFWQKTWTYLVTWKKEKRDAKLAEYVRKNFKAHLEGQLWMDLVRWIDDDREHCTNQVHKIFEDMADVIENRIKVQINALEQKESERANRNAQLIHYTKQVGKLLDQCVELRGQIDSARQEVAVNP